MSVTITAIFEQGVLIPKEPLKLKEHQTVRLILIEEQHQQADPARVAEMMQQIEIWLAAQPADAVRQPDPISPAERAQLDREFDDLLANLRRRSAQFTEEEIAADADAAVAKARAGS